MNRYYKDATQDTGRSITFSIIRFSIFALAISLLITGSIYQIQMLFTGGSTPITGVLVKALLICFFGAHFLMRPKLKVSGLEWLLGLFAFYLILDSIYLVSFEHRNILEILVNFNSAFSLLFLVGAAWVCPIQMSEKWSIRLLVTVFFICAILAAAQYWSGDPLIPMQNLDGSFKVGDWQTPDGVRAFSLFRNPGELGFLSAFMSSIAITMILRKRSLSLGYGLFVVSIVSCYMAGTRSAFVGFLAASITSVIIDRGRFKTLTKAIPLVWGGVGIAIAFIAYQRLNSSGPQWGLGGAATFGIRLTEWTFFLTDLSGKGVSTVFLGQGILQGDNKLGSQTSTFVDNTYLALVLQVGLMGAIIALSIFWKIWVLLLKRAQETQSTLANAAAALISTFFATALFEQDYQIVLSMLLVSLLVSHDSEALSPIRPRRIGSSTLHVARSPE